MERICWQNFGNSSSIFNCTRSQKSETLQQALHVRVGALQAFHAESAGNLREMPGELAPHLLDEGQFPVVMAEQSLIHERRQFSCRTMVPFSRSSWLLRLT